MDRLAPKLFALSALLAAVLVLVVVSSHTAQAHGTLDQTLQGNPDCPSSTFRGYEGVSTPQRQEVVPQLPLLVAFDVCVQGGLDPYNVEINLRSGDADNPGDIITSASSPAVASFAGWIHVDLPEPVTVTPGQKIVLEMNTAEPYSWFNTCRAIIGTCTSADSDLYPAGDTNSQYALDYAFRSYGETGAVGSPTPSPAPRQFGDLNCDSQINQDDGLFFLEHLGGLSPVVPGGCPLIGSQVQIGNQTISWGDIDCHNGVTAVDTLGLFRFLGGLVIIDHPVGCPSPNDTS